MATGREVFWDNFFYPWGFLLYAVNLTTWSLNRWDRGYSFINLCSWKMIYLYVPA